jgi:arylsulfatase A-like enzyme
VRFTNGFVTSPICVVSRATLLSGRYARNVQVHEFSVAIPPDIWEKSYPALMAKEGYFVGQLGKYGVGIRPREREIFGLFDASVDQGPPFRERHGEKLHDSEWLTRRTADFLDAVPAGQPFVLQVNYKAPHPSSVVAPEDEGKLEKVDFARRANETEESYAKLPVQVRNGFGANFYQSEFNRGGDHNPYLRAYFEKVLSVDRSVGAIMEDLKSRGWADNTVVVFTSDHGTHFGEKLLGGKWSPYEQSLRVPFIVADPRAAADRRGITCGEMVTVMDIAPTMLRMAGLPVPTDMDGRSLTPLLEGDEKGWRDHFFFEHRTSPARLGLPIPRSLGVRGVSTKLFRWLDPKPSVEVLHDLVTDPLEETNRVDDPAMASERKRLAGLLEGWLVERPDTYRYDTYGERPQSGSPEINWEKFKQTKPEEYERIASIIKKLGVTWEQALADYEVRRKICTEAGYWY